MPSEAPVRRTVWSSCQEMLVEFGERAHLAGDIELVTAEEPHD